MKKKSSTIAAVLVLLFAASVAYATVEWILESQLNFGASPLQMVPAVDVRAVFVLILVKIHFYSVPDKKIVDFVAAERKFEGIICGLY